MVLEKVLWFYKEPSPTEKPFWKWCLKEPFLKVLWDTFIGSLKKILIQFFNSFYLYSPFSQIINLSQSALQSVHIDILTFDLTSDQEKLPNHPGQKIGKKPAGEQQRRIPLQDGQNNRCNVYRRTDLELKHIQWIWQSVWIVGSRHGPRWRPPRSIRQMEAERRSGRSLNRAMA